MNKVLVLCTGNACRSQMLEGFLRNSGIDVQSAGVESHGLNSYAVKVMNELNIDISKNISKKINSLNINSFDILITVCDHAKESCQNITQIETKIHKSFIDPSIFIGSDEEKILIFRKIRDQISVFCSQFISQYFNLK
tara:strand:- start:849 stop:1262 length:414 start_codon:yes stop_codon:yes gene_type:complete